MVLKYREDADLEFMKDCDQEDLKTLTDILIYRKSGKKRLTQELAEERDFRNCNGDYKKVWDLIAAEMQKFGGDTFVNFARRGYGILYRDILIDVCKKMRVNFNKKSTTEKIEMNLLLKIVEVALDKMSEDEKRDLVKEMKLDVEQMTTQVIAAALQVAVRAGGFRAYQIALIVANAVSKSLLGRGLSLVANNTLARMIALFAGPIGIAINIVLVVPLFAGPAYRVLIPATIHVAYMRQKMLHGAEDAGTE